MPGEPPRNRVLSRVGPWLDRWHRLVAIVLAFIITPIAVVQLSAAVHLDWLVIQIIVGIMLAAILWAVIETLLAAIVAFSETEHEAEIRDNRLPAARLVTRRRILDVLARRTSRRGSPTGE